jgi:hypothetical protein
VTNEADKSKETGEDKGRCACPFCDAPVEKVSPLCEACGVSINLCSSCGKPIPRGKENCPDCNG